MVLAAAVTAMGLWSRAEEPDPWTPANAAPKAVQTLYQQGLDAAHAEDYAKALGFFESALAKDKDNADILTMTAFSQRKLGRLDAAFETYRKALALKPRHAKAREYLGEAHLQAALKELETLRGYGDEGKEEAARLKAALQGAAAKL
jgi:Tfp pilus assembly protein PilF